ncbi:MAG: 30S ribosomal protein S12 methylthiotransferase RimO [Bdellovibrionales bacterium]
MQKNLSDESLNKKVHFVSLGCPKNLVDSEIMLGSLLKEGYSVTDAPEEADTVVVNTCGFIEDSKKESIQKILEMGELKNKGQLKKLVVAGCLTQRYKDELVEGLPEADVFLGSGSFQNIAEILKNPGLDEKGEVAKRFFNLPTYLQEDGAQRVNSQPGHRAYLKISEGCKKRCAFCAIPLIRGNLQSRGLDAVVSESKLLVAGGVQELIVISHDFTDYGWDLKRKDPERQESPYELLRRLSDESGAKWIRLLYLYPDGIGPEVVQLIKQRENLLNYFDMPLQHINDQVLKTMNRRISRQQIVDCLDNIRAEIPDATIRTQFIVGFPGETQEQFEELLEFVEEQKFDRVGCFKYSPEENTKAGSMENQVDEETKQQRYDALMQLQQTISREKQQQMIGKVVPAVIEGVSEETDLLLQGRTSMQAPDIDGILYVNEGTAQVGEIVQVEITDAHDYDLVGHII